jgi:prepilin-type N-terminal cleavage/methylation domain-containing protein
MSKLQQRLEARRNENGFTLIEMLIVIIVLGILASIVVFGVAQFRSDSEKAACKADLKTVSVAVDAYTVQTGGAPASIDALVAAKYLKNKPAAASDVNLAAGVVTSGACAL